MHIHPIKGLRELWLIYLKAIATTDDVHGVEWLFAIVIHFLHVLTVSGWIKFSFDPLPPTRIAGDVVRRNNAIECWVVLELVALIYVVTLPGPLGRAQTVIAGYFLFEILLNLYSIIFVGKLPDIYPPTPSIERALLLFGFNIIQVTLIYAIFYRVAFGYEVRAAIFDSALVLGTLGAPQLDKDYHWWWIVAAQILTDIVLLVVFLGAFVGNLGAFDRTVTKKSRSSTSD
jgi:hypothetical protein